MLQTFEAKSLATKMTRVYERVIALEVESKPHIDLLSKIYIEDTWSLRKIGDAMVTCDWFKEKYK